MKDSPLDLVMLVDDNDTDNFISKRLIEMTNFAKEIVIKNSGKSALEYLQSGQKLPSLIFLDINMPVVDGFIFLVEFEGFPDEIKNKSKVAILSSSDNKQDIERIVENEHVIQFITKPLSESALSETLQKLNNA